MTPLDQATFWRGQLGSNLALSAAAVTMLDRAYQPGAPPLEKLVILNAIGCTDTAAGQAIHHLGGVAAAW